MNARPDEDPPPGGPTDPDPADVTAIDITGIDSASSLAVLLMLPGDPTVRLEPTRLRRATLTPDGPGSIDLRWGADGGTAQVDTHGPGADWLRTRAAGLLGCDDDPSAFDPTHPTVRQLWRRRAGLRVIRTDTVWHDLAWWIVQQRVTRQDAARQWRRLVHAHGQPAPGHVDLYTPPSPAVVARLPLHEFHRLGIERRRAQHLISAARHADRLAGLTERPFTEAAPVLRAVEGIGPWTTSGLGAVTWGEADTVIVGDSGIPSMVTWMLEGERRGDDTRMLELLEPFRPHRYRIIQLAFHEGVRPPRRHHRLGGTDIRSR
jgi:3-methyladenine DNA glycosylase/8-oxoguanine DNA glycosylase